MDPPLNEENMRRLVCVWVASKPGRGSKTAYPEKKGFLRVDVTSGSGNKFTVDKKKVSATQMSPLFLGPVQDYAGLQAERFENLWQFSKVYPQLGHWDSVREQPTEAWTEWKKKGYKKLKPEKRGRLAKGIRTPAEVSKLRKKFRETGAPWTPRCSWWDGAELGYIDARKRIYVPLYARLVVETDAFKALQNLVAAGKKLLIIDLDGPPLSRHPDGICVTEASIVGALNDPSYPFGHGFVVAALLAGIDIIGICEGRSIAEHKVEAEPKKKKHKNNCKEKK